MKRILFILLLTIPFIGFGQGWEKILVFGDEDQGECVKQTLDGGYVICGTTYNNSTGVFNEDIILIKTDGFGDTIWTKEFDYGINNNGIGTDLGRYVEQTTDGGYIITGINSSNHIWLIKTNSIGDTTWTKKFESGYQKVVVKQTNDIGYIICGNKWSLNGDNEIILIKTDSTGSLIWEQTFGGSNDDISHDIQQTSDNGYILVGETWSYGNGDNDVWLIKTDSYGDSLWTKTYGGTNLDQGRSVQQTNDGGYIITGKTKSFGSGDRDVWLIKTDSIGDTLWTKTYGENEDDGGYSVQQTLDGGYIITGYITDFINEYDVCLIKTNSIGDTLWTKTYDGLGNLEDDYGKSVQQTSDGGYIICGTTEGVISGSGIYLIKTDSQGNITSTIEIPTPSSNRKLDKVIDLLGRETKPQKNTPFIEIYDDGSTEKKIVIE